MRDVVRQVASCPVNALECFSTRRSQLLQIENVTVVNEILADQIADVNLPLQGPALRKHPCGFKKENRGLTETIFHSKCSTQRLRTSAKPFRKVNSKSLLADNYERLCSEHGEVVEHESQ